MYVKIKQKVEFEMDIKNEVVFLWLLVFLLYFLYIESEIV